MKAIESEFSLSRSSSRVRPKIIRVISWNINRGLRLNGVIDFLAASSADLILLQETDIRARRTGYRNVPREVARALQMDYIFGREFEELAQGSRTTPAYIGQATLSRLPLLRPRVFGFRNQSSFWRPRWFVPRMACMQRRLGGRMSLVCEISLGVMPLTLFNVHLESRGGDGLRLRQLSELVNEIKQRTADNPALVAGDFNFDLSCGPAASLMAGAGISNPFVSLGGRRTVPRSRHRKASAIDWILTKGPLTACCPAILDSHQASDHFPLSLELRVE